MVEAAYSTRSSSKTKEDNPSNLGSNSDSDNDSYVVVQDTTVSNQTFNSPNSYKANSKPATPLSKENSSKSQPQPHSSADESAPVSKKRKPTKNEEKTTQWTFSPVNARTIISARPGLESNFPKALDCASLFDYKLEDLGGLQKQIQTVSDLLFLPIKHPELIKRFNIKPTRGFLFYGPPGTGKTSVARALACKASERETCIAYFQFTASDILSKNVGESEAKLTGIFSAAKQWQPSIIFFDEIDGVIPARLDSDRPSASLVATFLHLMDGMGEKGDIVVIGSTNRLTSLDLAMRRPGRFEEEIYFPLPTIEARLDILRLTTSKWDSPPPAILLNELSQRTSGFSGADLKALCSRATINALTRLHPDVLKKKQNSSDTLLEVNFSIEHTREDFLISLASISPSFYRTLGLASLPLPPPSSELFISKVQETLDYINTWANLFGSPTLSEKPPVGLTLGQDVLCLAPVIVLQGSDSVSLQHILSTVIQGLDRFRIFDLDPFAACSQADRSGAASIQRQLDSLKKSEQGIFLIRDAHTYFDDCSSKIAAVLKMALLLPYKPGQVTFLVTSQGPVTGLGDAKTHTIINVDQISPSSLRGFCASFLDISMTPKDEVITRQLRNRCVVNSPKAVIPKPSEIDPEGFSDATELLIRDLSGLLPGQVLEAVNRLDMSSYRTFSDFIKDYNPLSPFHSVDSVIFGSAVTEDIDPAIPLLDESF